MSIIIGLCGPSASGKSTLAKMLAREYDAEIIALDNYFIPDPPYKKYENNDMNWELAENVDWPAAEKVVNDIKAGQEKVTTRKFSFETATYTELELPVAPMMIVDGFLLLYDNKLIEALDLTVYIDIPDHIGVDRRMKRGGKSAEYRKWYEEVTFPEYARHREKFKQKADLVLDGEKSIESNFEILKERISTLQRQN